MNSFDTAKFPEFLQDAENSRERLKQDLGNFWAGPDVRLENEIVAEPGFNHSCSNVILSKENFPPEEKLTSGMFVMLKQSIRSRFAQAGIDVMFSMFGLTEEEIKRINDGEKVPVSVSISNKGLRPVKLSGEIFRFYWLAHENQLRGKDLIKTAEENLKIEGEYGKDWVFTDEKCQIMDKNDFAAGEAVSIIFYLNKKNKFYIPKSREPLEINNRQDLENALKKIPEGLELDFKIGETCKTSFNDKIVGEINTAWHDDTDNARHARSVIIDPGFGGSEGRPIRAELEGIEHPDFIELSLFKVKS